MVVLEINKLLEKMIQARGSDIYIACGSPPRMNVEGKLYDMSPDPLSPEETKQIILAYPRSYNAYKSNEWVTVRLALKSPQGGREKAPETDK